MMADDTAPSHSPVQSRAPVDEPHPVDFPVDTPLTANYDPVTGRLSLESTVQQHTGSRELVNLKLDFSADAVHAFFRLVKVLETEIETSAGATPQVVRGH